MKKYVFMTALLAACVFSPQATAASLTIAPYQYDSELKTGETKKGFVDIANPTGQSVTVTLEAQGFRQVDNQGNLEFYKSDAIQEGVQLDLEEFELTAYRGARVYFLLDSTKLPAGDVFAAILATSKPKQQGGSTPAVRVGTLLLLTNGTPGPRDIDIQSINSPWLQIGNKLQAGMTLRNTADPKTNTGFIPELTVAAKPYTTKKVKGPLLFAGKTRNTTYVQQGDFFGPMYLAVTSGGTTKGTWLFAITGYWQWLAPVLLGVIAVAIVAFKKFIIHRSGKRRHKRV